jgi:hypothetical protein
MFTSSKSSYQCSCGYTTDNEANYRQHVNWCQRFARWLMSW